MIDVDRNEYNVIIDEAENDYGFLPNIIEVYKELLHQYTEEINYLDEQELANMKDCMNFINTLKKDKEQGKINDNTLLKVYVDKDFKYAYKIMQEKGEDIKE